MADHTLLGRAKSGRGSLTLGSVVSITGSKLEDWATLAGGLGMRSVRTINKLKGHWRHCVIRHELRLLDRCLEYWTGRTLLRRSISQLDHSTQVRWLCWFLFG